MHTTAKETKINSTENKKLYGSGKTNPYNAWPLCE